MRVSWLVQRRPFQRSMVNGGPPDPIAMHPRGDQHETASSDFPGPGTGSAVQCFPSQRSASGWSPVPIRLEDPALLAPTARHALADGHDTASRESKRLPGWFCRDHRLPFHRSTSDPKPVSPTAVQAVVELHDTPLRKPGILGVLWKDHSEPFHRSTTVFSSRPTAMQSVADGQDTPSRNAGGSKPAGTGKDWTDHADPFHCSMIGRLPPNGGPTAVQAVADEQDTELRSSSLGYGLGICGSCWMVQVGRPPPASASPATDASVSAAATGQATIRNQRAGETTHPRNAPTMLDRPPVPRPSLAQSR